MTCSTEDLQAFLDGELEPADTEAVRIHLGRCPACRRELSRLRLLWLELEQDKEIEVPYELPYIRQQAIAKAGAAMREIEVTPGVSYWDAQKLAWQPVLAGVSQIPGPRQLGRLARTAGRGLPVAVRAVSALLGAIAGRRRGRP